MSEVCFIFFLTFSHCPANCLTVLKFSGSFTTTAHGGYKEHLLPHGYYCWLEIQHTWWREIAVMAGRVLSYTGLQPSMCTLSCLWKTLSSSPTKCEKDNCFACKEHSIYRDSLKRSWQPWAGFIDELCLPGCILYLRLMKPTVHHNVSGLSAQWIPGLPPGGRHWGPGMLLQHTEGCASMQGMLFSAKETSLRASAFYFHIKDMELPLYLSQIPLGVFKQLLDMKLLETRSECR